MTASAVGFPATRCTRCRAVLPSGSIVECVVEQRPWSRIDLEARVTRGTQMVIKPYCDDCVAKGAA